MTEQVTDSEVDETKSLVFSSPVDINGLPYVFEGRVPNRPEPFTWSVRVEDPQLRDDSDYSQYEPVINQNYPRKVGLTEGKVGYVLVSSVVPTDKQPSIGISMIRSFPEYLKGYKDAKGVGAFLLENLCALADINGWRIYLEPIARDSMIPQLKLYEWYKKHGFKDEGEIPDESRASFGGMVRIPSDPDSSQVIARIFNGNISSVEKSSQLVQFEGLDLHIQNNPNDRGFMIVVGDKEFDSFDSYEDTDAAADFWDGLPPGYAPHTKELTPGESILYLYYIRNNVAEPGTATKLIKFGLEEGKRRGFERGVTSIFNPKIIKIIEKLVSEGLVKKSHYFTRVGTTGVPIPPASEDFLIEGQECDAENAMKFLQSAKLDEDGFVVDDIVVDCIFDF